MKKIINYSSFLVLLGMTFLFTSCKKEFLEIESKGKLIAKTTNDYQLLLTNLDLVNMFTDGQVPLGDEMAAVDPYFTGAGFRTQQLFGWQAEIYRADEDAPEMGAPMRNIYLYNKVINEVMNSTGGTDQQKQSIIAQAKVGRAWSYFLLINYYGKPYLESTAANDPGFPIITEADVTETQFKRASVKEVYDFIVNDLTSALPNLPTLFTHRLLITKATGEAILGKVYVFMHKFNEALPLLNNSLAGFSNGTIPAGLYNYNETFGPGGIFLPIGFLGPAYPAVPDNIENVFTKQFINYWSFTNNELVINPQTVALFKPSDLRLNFFSKTALFGFAPYPDGMLRRIGPASVQFGVIIPDIYLLQAECKARLNDLPGAVNTIEAFRKNRMPEDDAVLDNAIASNQTALVKFILDERIREFAGMGFRWFDMRRLSVDSEYSSTVKTNHDLYTNGAVSKSFTLSPERLVLKLPAKILDRHPEMPDNQ